MKSAKTIPCLLIFILLGIQAYPQNKNTAPHLKNEFDQKALTPSETPIIDLSDISSNQFHLNFLGYGSLFSFKVEKLLAKSEHGAFSLAVGGGYNTEICLIDLFCQTPQMYYLIPHQFTRLIGKKRYYLEIGVGGSAIFVNDLRTYTFYPIIGYRKLPKKRKGSIFSVYLCPVVAGSDTYDLSAPFGLSMSLALN